MARSQRNQLLDRNTNTHCLGRRRHNHHHWRNGNFRCKGSTSYRQRSAPQSGCERVIHRRGRGELRKAACGFASTCSRGDSHESLMSQVKSRLRVSEATGPLFLSPIPPLSHYLTRYFSPTCSPRARMSAFMTCRRVASFWIFPRHGSPAISIDSLPPQLASGAHSIAR